MRESTHQLRDFAGLSRLGLVQLFLMAICLILPVGSGATEHDLALIEAEDLYKQKDDWVVLDARPAAEWGKEHLPGSILFSWEDYTRTDASTVPYRIWSPHELGIALGQMGVDENTPIVVYGDAETSWGGEGWVTWALVWIGHKGPVRMLGGGIQAWRNAELPLASGTSTPSRPPLRYRISERSELLSTTAELRGNMDEVVLIDTRSGWEWFKGHLPKAVHMPWKDLFTGQDNRPIAPAAYRKLLEDKDVPLDKPLVFYCTGGIRSGYAWLIHQLAGFTEGSNYEGGTEAWEKLRSP